MRSPRLLLVGLLTLAMTFPLAGATAQGAETGVVTNGPTNLSTQSAGQLAPLGVGWVRAFLPWGLFEPNRGLLNEPEFASLEAGLAALPKGTKVILDVVNTPQWESSSANPVTPPRNPDDYARFIGAMARRFAGHVAAWEIWNEEDASLWWAGGPDPAAYTALLKAAYPAVKAADPKATVVLGGLTGNDYEYLCPALCRRCQGLF